MDNRKISEERIDRIVNLLFLEKNDAIERAEVVALGVPRRTLDGWMKRRKLSFCVMSKKVYFSVKDLICFFDEYPHERSPYHMQDRSYRNFLRRAKQSISKRGLKKAIPRPIPPPNSGDTPGIDRLESGRWRAVITIRGKRYQLGTYENKADAVAARKEIEDYVYNDIKLSEKPK